jgi:hypothetical protein
MKHIPSTVLAVSVLCLLGMRGQDAAPVAPSGDQVAPERDAAAPAATRRPIYGETIQLFNGKNLDDWEAFFIGGTTDPAEAFFVEDGILKTKGMPIGYIRTKQKYTSYHLAVEWRFDVASRRNFIPVTPVTFGTSMISP